MARVISICNQKGGVGKTTTAVNLAACLAAAEKNTILLDLDPQANATTGVGLDKTAIKKSVYEVIIGHEPVESVMYKTELSHLSVIPSHNSLVGAELELVSVVSRETQLKQALSSIVDKFDYIIIDCPPSLGLLTLNALTASNFVIIPVQCEYYAMEGLASLKKTVQLVKQRLNPMLEIKGIVLTMFDARNNLAHQVVEELRSHLNEAVFDIVIPRNVRLSEAPSHGKPIILYDVKSKGSTAYFELAQEVLSQDFEIIPNKIVIDKEEVYATATEESAGEGACLPDQPGGDADAGGEITPDGSTD